MKSVNDIVVAEKQSISPVAITPMSMMAMILEKGLNQESAAAFRELAELSWKFEERDAKKQFTAAFVALQADMPNITAMKPVPNRDGTLRYKFAPYEEIMEKVGPLLDQHGFTVSFSTDYKEGRLIKVMELEHIGGHKKISSFAVRIGGGPPGATETQADGAAATYAKRGALCDALNIVIDHDDDARAEGSPITLDQAEELQRRVMETESNEVAFLKLAGVIVAGAPNLEHYKQIASTKYAMLDEMLAKKESRGR